jgi:antitoxin component YwqK of YwqJK toxin-antitoxin module
VEMSGSYRAGERVGIWNFWYKNGVIKEQVNYPG